MNLISDHLKRGCATVMVGAGFSRNADTQWVDMPLSSTWEQLADAFINKRSIPSDENKTSGRKRINSLGCIRVGNKVTKQPALNLTS